MTTARDYAASLGLARPNTRGRLSNAAKEAIAEARKQGMTFTDDVAKPIIKAVSIGNVSDDTDEVSKPTEDDEQVVKPIDKYAPNRPNWTTQQYILFEEPAGMVYCKTPCRNCGYSINNCRCSNPCVSDYVGGTGKVCARIDD